MASMIAMPPSPSQRVMSLLMRSSSVAAEGEDGAAAGGVVEGDGGVERRRQLAHDGQAEAHAGAGVVAAEEALEDALAVLRGHARSVVAHGDGDDAVALLVRGDHRIAA